MADIRIPGPDHPITITPTAGTVTVTVGGRTIATSTRSLTLQESTYPAVQYVPLEDVDPDVLTGSDHATYCPYKGDAAYYSLPDAENAVWTYHQPYDAVAAIAGHVAFYAERAEVTVQP